MSIYAKNGLEISSAYSKSGESLEVAYDKSGNVVYDKHIDPYAYYSIVPIYNKSRENSQGMDIYGNYIVIFRDDNYAFQFVNMTTWETDYVILSGIPVHGNDISFSSIFYDDDDEFPLLFLHVQKGYGYMLRLNVDNLTVENVTNINYVPSGDTWVVYGAAFNDDATRFYCLGYNTNNYSDPNGFIFLETWDVSESLEYPTRLSTVTREWFPCIQGVTYHDGLLWVASGMDNPVKVFAIDLSDASIVKTVDLLRTGELEGIGWGYDQDTHKYFCVYGQIYNGITYYRIDFSARQPMW